MSTKTPFRILSTPVMKQDPITKQWKEVTPTLLPWMTEALNRGQTFKVVPDHHPSHKRGG